MQYPSRMLVSALVALSSLPVLAQENANTGKLLYDDTANSSSLNNVGSTCAQCHDITSRRAQLAGSRNSPGSPYANIEFDQAMARFQQAVQSQSGMTIFGNLTSQEARDIGAYLSDTPKTSPSVVTGLSFSASAVNQATAAQNVDLSNSVVTGSPSLVNITVSISGANAARFTLTQDSCTSQTLAAAASCRVGVRYTPTDTSLASAQLTLTMRQGTSPTFTRVLPLSGSVATTPPPATGGGDSGGGALGLGWLAALALAITAIARGRRAI
jgi:cytochrome c553